MRNETEIAGLLQNPENLNDRFLQSLYDSFCMIVLLLYNKDKKNDAIDIAFECIEKIKNISKSKTSVEDYSFLQTKLDEIQFNCRLVSDSIPDLQAQFDALKIELDYVDLPAKKSVNVVKSNELNSSYARLLNKMPKESRVKNSMEVGLTAPAAREEMKDGSHSRLDDIYEINLKINEVMLSVNRQTPEWRHLSAALSSLEAIMKTFEDRNFMEGEKDRFMDAILQQVSSMYSTAQQMASSTSEDKNSKTSISENLAAVSQQLVYKMESLQALLEVIPFKSTQDLSDAPSPRRSF